MTDPRTVRPGVGGMSRATSKNVTGSHLARRLGMIAVDANRFAHCHNIYHAETAMTTVLGYRQ